MGIDIKAIEKKKNEFIAYVEEELIKSNVIEKTARKNMEELDQKISQNILELSRLLGSGHS